MSTLKKSGGQYRNCDVGHLNNMNNIEKIRQELLRLFRRQMDALDSASFEGMTDEGWREYDERHARIHALSEQIRLKPAA